MTHVPTSLRSTKFLGLILVSALLFVGAFFVPAPAFNGLCAALPGIFGAYCASNVWAGRRAQATDEIVEPRG